MSHREKKIDAKEMQSGIVKGGLSREAKRNLFL